MKTVDARGLSCPEPTIMTRQALDARQFPIQVLVDSVTSRENVRRMAERAGCKVTLVQVGEEFQLTLSK